MFLLCAHAHQLGHLDASLARRRERDPVRGWLAVGGEYETVGLWTMVQRNFL